MTDSVVSDAKNRFFKTPKHPTAVDQILIESEWTDYIQNLVDFGNCHYLKNFFLKLEMEYED